MTLKVFRKMVKEREFPLISSLSSYQN